MPHENYPLVAVVAMARNRVIGDGEKLLWHLPGDLKRVKMMTMGRPMIMGRRTYESIGRPLPGRANIVLTSRRDYRPDGVMIAHDPETALAMAAEWISGKNDRIGEIIIFGGGEIYRAFLDRTDRVELTEVDLAPEGSATFPGLEDDQWQSEEAEIIAASGDAPGHAFLTLNRR